MSSLPPAAGGEAAAALPAEALAERSNLTRGQLLIWMGQQLDPQAPLYNMALRFDIAAELDTRAFAAAFQALVDRSDALRSVFTAPDGLPRLDVLARLDCRPAIVDLADEPDPEAAARAWIAARCRRAFDLAAGSLDTALLRLAAGRWVWYLNQHHLTTDAWSTALVYRLMARAYALAREGRLDELPPLPAHADFAAYERAQRESAARRAAQAHWLARTRQAAEPLRFYGRAPQRRRSATERLACPLGAARSARLKALAQAPGVRALSLHMTLFQLFATALFAYLGRVCDSRAPVIGSPAHNRPSLAFRETIGLFIEMFPLSVEIDEGESFRSLLGRVAAETQAFLRHALPGTSSPAGARAFNVVLNYVHAEFGPFGALPARAEWVHAGHGDPRHDLRLQVHDFAGSGDFLFHFDFNCDTFPAPLRARAPGHFLRLLDALLADPDQRIDGVALADRDEREALVTAYNRRPPAAPPGTVLALFAAQCARRPDAVAVSLAGSDTSYRQLDEAADRLAVALRAIGLGRGATVGLHLERSVEMVVALIAVLRAGAAFLPLDPGLPERRLRFMLGDAAAACVLTQQRLRARLPAGDWRIVCVDADLPEAAAGAAAAPPPAPADLAYVLYTSGSTGAPKGVLVEHRGLHEYIDWAQRFYAAGAPADFPLYSSLGFDFTLTSIFVPLACGGRIVVYPDTDGPADLTVLRVFDEDRVDVVKLTPAHLALLAGRELRATRVRSLILGGEDLGTAPARRASDAFGGRVAIFNEYGPTEAVVGCMIHRYDPEADRGASVPIGVPADGVRIYVLDAGLNPVPEGVVGELYIARPGLARGYLGRDALSAERFLPDPFQPGARMYRSGDLARFRPGPLLDFLGRADGQVKIRGVRIEPAEIERSMLELDDIEACAVEVVPPRRAGGDEAQRHCERCGLASSHPGIAFDAQGVCSICREFDGYRQRAQAYFRSLDDLRAVFDGLRARRRGDYDCMMLVSGGKDSTYALYQLAALGAKIYALTLDNGFISDEAKGNIRRAVAQLGIDHEFATTPAMNAIFVDSLKRHSNVCQGCFKTLYTLALRRAAQLAIPCIVTGLSRGQLFETRLTPELFRDEAFDAEAIDRTVLAARKAYHRVDDAVARLLDVDFLRDERIFDEIRFIDFYRYCDVPLQEVYAFLASHAPWIRPRDTGRSTNCLINDTGIHVHKRKEGFHNYALPYSWDVRLGHKRRDQAIDELRDRIDVARVHALLAQIGYDEEEVLADPGEKRLAAYYVARGEPTLAALKAALATRLPASMIPSHFVRLERLPLTANGKLDRRALPDPRSVRAPIDAPYRAPRNVVEESLAGIWRQALGVERVGVDDNFFDLGGDSIIAIQIVARANAAGLRLAPSQLFQHPSVAELARAANPARHGAAARDLAPGPVPLTPVQRWFFAQDLDAPERYNHVLRLELREAPPAAALPDALRALVARHDALRMRFTREAGRWQQRLPAEAPEPIWLHCDLSDVAPADRAAAIADIEGELHDRIDLAAGRLFGAALIGAGPGRRDQLLLVAHHLAVDVVSWLGLLDELDQAWRQLGRGEALRLPPPTASFKSWAAALDDAARDPALVAEAAYWDAQDIPATPPPPGPAVRESSTRVVSVALDAVRTRALTERVLAAHRIKMNELLLAALALELAPAGGRLRVELESHGREGLGSALDLSRSVGWFTAIHPLAVEVDADRPLAETLAAIAAQLRGVPRNGIGYGLLRHGAGDPRGGLLFNFMSRSDHLLPPGACLSLGAPLRIVRAATARRCHAWDINAYLGEDGLRIDWGYSAALHGEDEMRARAGALEARLAAILAAHAGAAAAPLGAADFPLARLDARQLGRVAELLAGKK